jgi:hypothetical protein
VDVSTAVLEIRARLQELTADFWTASEVLRALNEGVRRFAAQERWPWLWTVETGTQPASTSDLELVTGVPLHRVFNLMATFDGDPRPRFPKRVEAPEGMRLRGQFYTESSEPVAYYLVSTSDSGANEVQSIANTGSTAGTFTITFDGQTTTTISRGASKATIKDALVALSNISPGDIKVTGGPLGTNTVFVEFKGNLASENVPVMTLGGTTTDMTVATVTGGGTPAGTYISTVRFVPTVNREFDFEYAYMRVPSTLSADSDVLDVPEEYAMGPIAYATGHLWLKELRDSRKADEQFGLFQSVVDDAKRELRKLDSDTNIAWGRTQPEFRDWGPLVESDPYRHFSGPLG